MIRKHGFPARRRNVAVFVVAYLTGAPFDVPASMQFSIPLGIFGMAEGNMVAIHLVAGLWGLERLSCYPGSAPRVRRKNCES